MSYVIAEPCIGTKDTACVDACPVDCIHPKKDEGRFEAAEMIFIDPVECIDCGACVPVCPVSAIFAKDDLPEKWSRFEISNAAFYLIVLLEDKFGAVPADVKQRIDAATVETIQKWKDRVAKAAAMDEVFK